ncbi:MAG TPA: YbaB/EbfC family nucleoid-associated protein [Patescibacteria group bacterium]|nr:YbaB/EbfC family nucleoid-associated protein [Patescibacteria group bacterium]
MGITDSFQQMRELKKMRDQAMAIQRELAAEEIEVEDKGIKVVITGDQKIQTVEIKGEKKDDLIEVLNEAIKKSQEVAAQKLQQMGGGLGGLLGK